MCEESRLARLGLLHLQDKPEELKRVLEQSLIEDRLRNLQLKKELRRFREDKKIPPGIRKQ